MLKINFTTPLPNNTRNSFIKCMKELGFTYDRIIQPGEFSLLRFYGELPELNCNNFSFVICADGKNKTDLLEMILKSARCEITIPFKRED